MSDFEIDEKTRAALGRLTAAERECLARRLRHQTAKEMALDLGISPHAVEKRLKMARTKLGLSSSLDAARLLAAFEQYHQTAPQAPDLDPNPALGDKPTTRSTTIGVFAMCLVLAATTALLLAQPPSDGATASPFPALADEKSEAGTTIKIGMGDLGTDKASPERARRYARQMFDREDKDRSGYIEFTEAPNRLEMAEPRSPDLPPLTYSETKIVKVLEGDAARTSYVRGSDGDGDNRISFAEYAATRAPYYEQRGIPLIPADWTPAP